MITLSRQLLTDKDSFQYLNWDISSDRRILQDGSWSQEVPLLIFDEIHKMPNWKIWLKGIADSRLAQIANTDSQAQKILIAGSVRMDTFRQSGESLAGRYFSWCLHPISVKELVDFGGMNADQALDHLLVRGGFLEPCLAETDSDANRWRQQYFTDLIREDILEFSRIQEVNTMRLFVEMLRDRVGSPLSLASLARDLSVTQPTLKRYLDILEALFVVFVIHPWHSNVARSLLKAPKVYFMTMLLCVVAQAFNLKTQWHRCYKSMCIFKKIRKGFLVPYITFAQKMMQRLILQSVKSKH